MKSSVVDDPFCVQLRDQLAMISKEWSAIPFDERIEMLKLVAGLLIVFYMASGAALPARSQLNYVLRSALGTGYSWYTCMQFLSGQRARAIFAKRQENLRVVGGAPLMRFANHVLPDMQNNFYKIFAPSLQQE